MIKNDQKKDKQKNTKMKEDKKRIKKDIPENSNRIKKDKITFKGFSNLWLPKNLISLLYMHMAFSKSQYNDCWWAKWSKSAETWFFGMTLVNLWKQWNRLRVRSWSKTWVVTDVQPWMPWISNMFSTGVGDDEHIWNSFMGSSQARRQAAVKKHGPSFRNQHPSALIRESNHREFPCPLLKPTERLGLWSSAEVRSGSGSMFFKCSREEENHHSR